MSTAENQSSNAPEPDFDLEKHFVPAWAKKPSNENQYAHYAGEAGPRDDRRRGRGDRPPRPPGPPRPPDARRARPGPPDSRRPWDRENRPGRHEPPPREEKPLELLPVNITFVPDDSGVDSLARQIKMTGRAYPLFDIALMVLEKPERHAVTLSVRKNAEGTVLQPLFVCALDDTVWLAQDEAVNYVLDRHFTTFYQPERTQIDPPKGTYTFVAQCGMSGAILGPPNYHGYQEQLRKLHQERFARMPFEVFKARVKIVRDEAVVKKWVEDQSWRTEYVCLNLPEPLKLGSRTELESHFRQTHLANIIRQEETVHLSGVASRQLRQPALARLIRSSWEQQRRFPLQVATVLSQQFAARGLQFFKVNRSFTHVAVSRPHYLDLDAIPVSDGVRRIVVHVSDHPKCTRRQLVEALAPRPQAALLEGVAAPANLAEPTPEETQIVADLHWLVHQGHVIEFANGTLETAKKPLLKPSKPAPPETSLVPGAEPSSGDASAPAVLEPSPDNSGADSEAGPGTAPGLEPAAAEAPIPAPTPEPVNAADPAPAFPVPPSPGTSPDRGGASA
jgi:hypothetical protein